MMAAYAGIPLPQITYKELLGLPTSTWKEAKTHPSVPFSQLPLLELDDKRILAQSGAIDRYMAGLCKLLPEDPIDLAYVNSFYEAAEELNSINPIVNLWKGSDFEEKKNIFFTNVFPSRVINLNKSLGSGPYMGERSSISMADFNCYHHFYNILKVEPTCLSDYPNLQAYVERVANVNNNVKNYLATRPVPIDVGVKPMLAPQTERKSFFG